MKKSKKNFDPPLPNHKAILSLGCNLGDRKRSLIRAVEQLKRLLTETRVSSIYETSPVDNDHQRRQPYYYNLVMSGMTTTSPQELLQLTHDVEGFVTAQSIEEGFPYYEKQNKGPRYLDIDIVFFGEIVMSEPDIIIPHPAYHERLFVMIPLLEIEPNWGDPVNGKKISEIMKSGDFPGQKVNKI